MCLFIKYLYEKCIGKCRKGKARKTYFSKSEKSKCFSNSLFKNRKVIYTSINLKRNSKISCYTTQEYIVVF